MYCRLCCCIFGYSLPENDEGITDNAVCDKCGKTFDPKLYCVFDDKDNRSVCIKSYSQCSYCPKGVHWTSVAIKPELKHYYVDGIRGVFLHPDRVSLQHAAKDYACFVCGNAIPKGAFYGRGHRKVCIACTTRTAPLKRFRPLKENEIWVDLLFETSAFSR